MQLVAFAAIGGTVHLQLGALLQRGQKGALFRRKAHANPAPALAQLADVLL